MLKALPDSWFSWNFTIFDERSAVAKIDLAWVREAGELHVDGSSYRVYREGLLNGAFILEKEGAEIARAEKPGILFRSFKVESGGKIFMVDAESALGRKFVLSEGGQTLGSVQPEHALTRRAIVDLPEDIALPVRIFIVWLILILWKRDAE